MAVTPTGSWRETYQVWLDALGRNYRELIEGTGALLPRLLGAALMLVAGWLLALALRALVGRLARGLDRLFDAARHRAGASATPPRWPLSRVLAWTVYWLTLFFFLTAAVNILDPPGVPELLTALLRLIPTVLVTAALLLVVYLLSGLVAERITAVGLSAGLAGAAALGRLARVLLLTFAAIIAIGHVGIDVALLVNLVTVVAALALGGAAVAFGLGAADEVRNIIALRYLRRAYQVGQRVRIEDLEGEILEFTAVAVVIDAPDGRTSIPARRFSEHASVLLEPTG